MKPYYEHAGITIYHGDCREILPQLGRFDACVTDPPYGMSLNTDYSGMNGWSGKGKNHELVVGDAEPFDPTHLLTLECYPLVIFGAQYFASKLFDNGGWIVWDKRGDGAPSGICFGDCELAWTNKGQAVRRYSKMWHGVSRWTEEASFHPTQKPVDLMHWILAKFCEADDVVVDPYMGSAPVLIAAKLSGHPAVGIEIEEKYCEIAAKRLSQEVFKFTGDRELSI